jgi:CheY-like chemotaxis protein
VQAAGTLSAPDLLVVLDVQQPAVAGMSVFARIRVLNRGPAPVVTSARLNLMEGDLVLIVQGTRGDTRTLHGWQADTALRRATLGPGEEIANAINLLATDAGPVFPAPGSYQVTAEFTFAPRQPPLRSEPVAVAVRLPASDDEREVARLLQDAALRAAILLATPDSAPDALQALARFDRTPDGKLAALLVSADDTGETPIELAIEPAADAGSPATPESRALAVAMLQTPFSRVGRALADRFIAGLGTAAAQHDAPALPAASAMAQKIARRLPFKRT